MTHYRIKQSSLAGTITAPSSKSHSLRAILFATLAEGKSTIRRCLQSPDVTAMIKACQQLGASIKRTNSILEITGVAGKPRLPDDIIQAGNSGQVLRFVSAVAALMEGYTVITGDHSIRYNRPIKPLMDGLSQLGATCISTKNDDYAPLIVKGPIAPGTMHIQCEFSQPVSALLIACAFLKGKSTLIVKTPGQKPWIALTLDWFDRLNIRYTNTNFSRYEIEGKCKINAFDYTVPGDFSSLAYPLVAAIITHSEITLNNIAWDDPQGDKKLIDVLIKMGAKISIEDNSLVVHPSQPLRGIEVDINDFIDALPILAVMACYATGTTVIYNAKTARKKESDRLSTITTELKKMGALIIEEEDRLTITGSKLHHANLNTYHDHRIALSLAVAASAVNTPSLIYDIDCIDKSYSNFYATMKTLNLSIEEVL
jgi:3-phosphoshikimate 1-carboxyvinyltransferase